MKFSLAREVLLKPLQLVVGVVERRQTLPILSNVLLTLDGSRLAVTGTDLEVEIVGSADVASAEEGGEVTVSARKLLDIAARYQMAPALVFPAVTVKPRW